jgi:hypothetical protein
MEDKLGAVLCVEYAFLQYSDVSLCGYLRKLEKMLSISKKACDALSKRRETTQTKNGDSPPSEHLGLFRREQ